MNINEMLEENPKVAYFSIRYTDEYKTLYQSFAVSKKIFVESEGKVLNSLNSQIDPKLNWLYEITLFEEHKPIKTTYFNQDKSIKRVMIYDDEKGWINND